ncbi:unnamed protein product, partial [Onchocerca flexuosa]|uniref:Spaetzle domain-containing protein n=1 Tax=Onchocerca flexuosa TaxID=387005 RepID=A0A183I1B8_9BILA
RTKTVLSFTKIVFLNSPFETVRHHYDEKNFCCDIVEMNDVCPTLRQHYVYSIDRWPECSGVSPATNHLLHSSCPCNPFPFSPLRPYGIKWNGSRSPPMFYTNPFIVVIIQLKKVAAMLHCCNQ